MIIESQTDKHIYPAGNGQAVAIIGLGALFPGGRPGIAGYWSLVKNGRDAITDIPADHFLADDYFDPDPKARDRIYCRRGAFIPSVLFSPLKYGVTPKDLETIDSTQLLGLVIADEALRDAGYPTESHDNSRTAVIMGVTGALKMVVSLGSRLVHPQLRRALAECGIGPEMADKVLDRFAGKFPPWKESSFPGLLGNVTAGRVANRLDLGGPNMVVDAACASSLAAISQALAALRSGKADLVVSGGLDTFNDPFMFSCFSKTPALSPSGEVRSFDRQGDGTLLGEGVGIVVLKRLDEAIRDGDKIYASIASVGGSSDGKGTAVFAPSPSGQRRAIEAAYMEAGWHPSEVELVEAHGTGTAVGDEVELTALGYFFSSGDKGLAGDSQAPGPWCALGSVKSQIGHTKGAAGVAGLIKATLALHHKVLPPTIKVTEPLEPLTKNSFPLYLNDRARPWLSAPGRPRRAAVSAFGFGGSNFHCLLSEAPGPKPAESHPETHLAPLSADSPEALLEKLASFVSSLGQTDSDQAIDSLGRGLRGSFNHQDSERLILVGQPRDIRLMANKALEALKAGQRVPSIKGLHYGHGNAPVEPMGLWLPAMPGNPVVTAATIGRLGPALMDLGMAFPGIMSLLDLAEGLRAKYKLSNYNLGLILSPPALAPSAIKTGLHSELARPGVASLLWGLTQIAMAELAKGFRAQVTSIRREGLGNLACLCHSSLLGAEEALALAIELGRGSDRENLLAKLSKYVSDPGNTSQGPFGGLYPSAEACLKALLGEFPEGDFPDVGPLDSAPSPSQDNGTGNLSLAEIRLAGSSWQSFLSPDDPLRNLAETLARAASMGYAIDFKAWPGWPEEPEVPSGYAVPIGGANLFREPEPMPAKPLALQESQGLKGSLADAGALSQTLSEILLNQREGLSLLKSLAQPQAPGASPWPVASEALGKPPSFMASQMADSLPQGGLAGDGQLWPGQAPGFPDIEMPGPPAAGALKVSGGNGKSASFGLASPDLTGAVWERLAGIVSEETGYPAEALAPELELENDLGLDSIKKVELLSLLSEIFPSLSGAGPDLGQSLTLGELARLCESAISSPGQGAQGQDQAISTTAVSGAPKPSAPTLASLVTKHLPHPAQTLGLGLDEARETLFEILSAETGYPSDSLNLDMRLENDLGLDSIKKVELLSALSEKFPQASPSALADSETLGDILGALPTQGWQGAPSLAPSHEFANAPQGLGRQSPSVMEVVASETGYPVESLSPEMDLENDLGLDSIKKVEVLSLLSDGLPNGADPGILAGARTLGDWQRYFEPPASESRGGGNGRDTDAEGDSFLAQGSLGQETLGQGSFGPTLGSGPAARPLTGREILDQALGTGSKNPPSLWQVEPEPFAVAEQGEFLWPASGLVRLVGSDPLAKSLEKELSRLGYQVERRPWSYDFSHWRGDGLRPRVLFLVWPGPDRDPNLITQALQALESVGDKAKSIVGLSFLGGFFGFPRPGGVPGILGNSISGALVGLLKCAAREWPSVNVRVLDLPLALYQSPTPSWVTAILETASSQGPVELGLPINDRAYSLALKPYYPAISADPLLGPGDTVVVTGGGRGVTAAAMLALARLYRPRLVILGRTPLPPPEPDWLSGLKDQREIMETLYRLSNHAASPKELNARLALIQSSRELTANLKAISEAGAQVEYISGDFISADLIEETARKIMTRFGPIKGFIHGAGVLADHPIIGKNQSDFAKVYATKTILASHLLEAFQTEPLRFMVFFSSTTARFGRQGQGDYAAGNEVLNKIAWEMSTLHPNCRVLALNWGPWAGGMVNDSLAGQFKSQGLGLIGLKEGAETFLRLIRTPAGGPAEVVVLGQGTSLDMLSA